MRLCHPCPAISNRRSIPWQRSELRCKHRARTCRGERFQRYFCFQYKNYDLLTVSFKLSPSRLLCLGTGGKETLLSPRPAEHSPHGRRADSGRAGPKDREKQGRRAASFGLLYPVGETAERGKRASGGGGSLLHLFGDTFLRVQAGRTQSLAHSRGRRNTTPVCYSSVLGRREGKAVPGEHRPFHFMGTSHSQARFPLPH